MGLLLGWRGGGGSWTALESAFTGIKSSKSLIVLDVQVFYVPFYNKLIVLFIPKCLCVHIMGTVGSVCNDLFSLMPKGSFVWH